jgi:hypothetical protein
MDGQRQSGAGESACNHTTDSACPGPATHVRHRGKARIPDEAGRRMKVMILSSIIPDSYWRGRRLSPCAGLLILIVLLCVGMLAQAPTPAAPLKKATTVTNPVPVQLAGTPEMTAADVSAFLDGIMPEQLAREDIAGAVVLVIKDGKVLYTKGYGYADVDKKPGSLSFYEPNSQPFPCRSFQ